MRPRRPLKTRLLTGAIACAVACASLAITAPLLAAPVDRLEARARLADALYLESGMGDYRGALAVYDELARSDGIPGDLAAEALLRQGLAHELLGEIEPAEAAWLRLLELHPSSSRAADALLRLDRLERTRQQITSLPVDLSFARDLGGLLHARSARDRGQLDQGLVDVRGALDGIAAWRRWVAAGETDHVALGFADGLDLQGRVQLEVLTENFPVHLLFRIIDRAGRAHDSETLVVTPDQGWVEVTLGSSDFTSGPYPWTPSAGLGRFEIHDITGRRSTDRGESQILLDDLSVR